MNPKIAVSPPSEGYPWITVQLGTGEPVPMDQFVALALRERLGQCIDIARDQERKVVEKLPPLTEAALKGIGKPSPSTGFNEPKWVRSGAYLMQEWRDDQGRRVRQYVATFHEAAGAGGWMEKVLGAVVDALNATGAHQDLPAYRAALKGDKK